ncbi:MAG: nuclease-related domain-containing protein [Anaerolineae bacterium]
MTLDEALETRWLGSNPKPLRELLANGEIERRQLEWASRNAYKAQLKQAADIILKAMNEGLTFVSSEINDAAPNLQSLVPKMSEKQARDTKWLFNPHKGKSIGHLLDTGQLALKDLAYAVENAQNPHLRDASLTLMILRLGRIADKTASQVGFAHLISGGRSYALRRQIQAYFFYGAFMGVWLGISITILVQSLLQPRAERASIEEYPLIVEIVSVLAILLILVLTAVASFVLIGFIEKQFDSYVQRYRQGEEGEKLALDVVRHALNEHWYIFQNVKLPAQRADLDMVLVGPTGVWLLEVKHWNHPHRNEGDAWFYNAGKGWRRSQSNPSAQARKNAHRLSQFLRADGIQQWVTPVIIWTNSEATVSTTNPSVAVWPLESLRVEIENLCYGNTMPDNKFQQIIDKLKKLCEPKDS